MKLRFSKLPTGLGWSAWLLIAPLAGWAPPAAWAAETTGSTSTVGAAPTDGYTVNFSNVSVQEFIRFISKATGQNFIYDQDFADFPVTVISEEPTSAQNLITILVQVLRSQGYSLLEQGDNLLIHKSADVSQVAEVVTDSDHMSQADQGAIVTGVFRLRQTSPETLLPILQPMVSKTARIDASKGTNQIIVTDVSGNVKKIEQLLQALDAPNPLVTVATFDTMSAFSQETVDTAKKVLEKLIGGSPFFMEAQPDSQQVFIVASPFLVQQAKEVLTAVEKGQLTAQNGQPFFFTAQTQSADTLLASLQEVADGLKKNGVKKSDLINAIESAQVIPSSNSLLFLTDATSQKKIDDFLKQMDTPKEAKMGVNTLLFRPTQLSMDQLGFHLKEIITGLKASGLDADLLRVLETGHPLTGQGYLFSGSSATLDKIQDLLKQLDSASGGSGQAVLIPLQHIGPVQAQTGLSLIANSLKKEGISDEVLFRVIDSARGVNGSNLLILSGPGSATSKVKEYLKALDVEMPAGALSGTLTAIPVKGNGEQFLADLRKQAANFDPAIAQLVGSASYVPESNSIWVRGDEKMIGKLQELISSLQGTSVLVYKPKFTSLTGLQTGLLQFAGQLEAADYPNKALIASLQNIRMVPASNSLLFSGSQGILDEIQDWLTTTLDTANPSLAATKYYIFRPANGSATDLIARLKEFSDELGSSGLSDPGLLAALSSAQPADNGRILVISADEQTIPRVEEILKEIEAGAASAPEIYAVKSLPAGLLKQDLIAFLSEMGISKGPYAGLQKVAATATIMPDGSSIALMGSDAQIKQIKTLLEQLDKPASTQSQFALFPVPASVDPQTLMQTLQKLAAATGGDRLLQQTLKTAQYIPQSHAISLNGSEETVKSAQELLENAVKQVQGTETIAYYPTVVSPSQLANELKETAASMQKAGANYALVKSLQSVQMAATGKGLLLQVQSDQKEEVNKILAHLDASTGGFQLKLLPVPEGVAPSAYIKAIDDLNTRLKKAGLADKELEAALRSRELVGDAHTVSFTGTATALAQMEQYLQQLNYKADASAASTVYVYQLKEVPPAVIQASLNQVATDLSASQNPQDQQVAKTLRAAKYLESNHSLLFSGSPDVIAVVQKLVPSLDTVSGLPGGKPQIFLYRVQTSTVESVEAGLKALSGHLANDNPADAALAATIQTMKPLPDGKTILFTGDPATLQRLQQQLATLDGGGAVAGASAASKFLIYPLQAATATRVEADLKALAASLQKSGLDDPSLFRSIATMQVDVKANSVIFSGDEAEFKQLKPLIAIYDQATEAAPDSSQTVIEPVANSAFMVYPLRYMLGNEIESTLRQMGKDLQTVKSTVNENLLHAISTMQWIQASNTLCFSGDAATLEKLKVLITNLDQPLRQVFVEVLVLNTSLQDSYTFGLDWAGQGQIDPNYGIGFANSQSNSTAATNLLNAVGGLDKTQPVPPPPMGGPASVVTSGNFSLSAIGNVIRHNGQTFFDLGSLVNALQSTSVATVVLNPKIIAQDSNTATIYVGRTYGFITQQTSVFSTSTANATTIDYRSVGVNLSITPIITGDSVTLDIDQVYSDIIPGFGPSTSQQPSGTVPQGAGAFPINNTHLATRAHVPDQAILCISGLITNNNTQGTTQIPCLGGLPLVGALFTSETENKTKDTLLIFIKPYILQSLDEMRAITQANAKLLRQSSDCYGVDDVQAGFDSIGYDKIPKTRDAEVPCIIE
jgi:type II secretory pathway component GspD/PulD (secretin)